jgi:hypothetical protein
VAPALGIAAASRSLSLPVAAGLLLSLLGSSPAAFAQQACDTSQYPLSTPTARFEAHADGTVTDRQSNLMWLRCSAGQEWSGGNCTGDASRLTWQAAQELAQTVNARATHFFNDWRLPQITELATIAERQCQNPRINLAVFISTPAAAYWSFSSRQPADAEVSAFALSFGPEGVMYQNKEAKHYVRLVRNAP